jgi:hypothetical protein
LAASIGKPCQRLEAIYGFFKRDEAAGPDRVRSGRKPTDSLPGVRFDRSEDDGEDYRCVDVLAMRSVRRGVERRAPGTGPPGIPPLVVC